MGKGTQCSQLARDLCCEHISVGDLLRDEAESKTSVYADFINDSMKNSVVIPADLTVKLLQERIGKARSNDSRIFIVDGFPRSIEQAYAFDEKVWIIVYFFSSQLTHPDSWVYPHSAFELFRSSANRTPTATLGIFPTCR